RHIRLSLVASASQASAAARTACGPGEKFDASRSKKGGHADSGSRWHSARTSRASVAPDTSPRSERSEWHSASASPALRRGRPDALDGRTKSPMMRLMKEPVAITLYDRWMKFARVKDLTVSPESTMASACRCGAGLGGEPGRLGPA